MLADPTIAEQIRAEMALRRGFKELAKREGAKGEDAAKQQLPDNVMPFERRKKG